MTSILISEILGKTGIYNFLKDLRNVQEYQLKDIENVLTYHGVDTVKETIEDLMKLNIIFYSAGKIFLTKYGNMLWLLTNAINEGNIHECFKHLSILDPTLLPYELVKEGMTLEFVHNLFIYPNFKRLLICSPWIHLKKKTLRKLQQAIYLAQGDSSTKIEFVVISRPINKKDIHYASFFDTFDALIRLGAEIVVNEKLHSKLYIRDQGPSGGITQAIFGSENLTGANNVELGIKINNDLTIINKLIEYFFNLYLNCKPYKEE